MNPDHQVSAFAPGTVGNVICGFDTLGLALAEPGDVVTLRRSGTSGLRVVRITGDDGRLPLEPTKNSASVAVAAFMSAAGLDEGVEIELDKGLPLSGGMGGSAASSVAAVVAANALFQVGAPDETLLECALAGEGMVSGDAHLDNVAPALFGGLLLVRPSRSHPVVRLPIPEGLSVALLHPSVEMNTREGRQALGSTVPLKDAIIHWGNTAAFVEGLNRGDWDLIADALEDRVTEPVRAPHIPAFSQVRQAALAAGALGCGISGAGPAIFTLCRTPESAEEVGQAMLDTFTREADPPARIYLSPVASTGATLVPSTEAAPS